MSLAGDYNNSATNQNTSNVPPVNPNTTAVHQATVPPAVVPQPRKYPTMPKFKRPGLSLGKLIGDSVYIKYLKLATIGFLLFGLFIGFIYVLKIDTLFFKLDLSGVVYGLDKKPVANAEIYINDEKKTVTDINGRYKIGGLNMGDVKVKVVAQNYFDKEGLKKLTRSFMSYSNSLNVQLESSLIGSFKGKFIANSGIYDFANDRLIVNDKSYKINPDGSFDVKDAAAGKVKLIFTSKNFIDINQEIEIKPADNILSDITLTPGGDIEDKLVGYIKEEIPTEIEFQATNISPENIKVDGNGGFEIRDLEVGKKYDFRIFAKGYLTRDYSVTIEQGVNRIFGLKMVEEGKAIFSKPDDRNKTHLYVSEYDGGNLAQLTSDDRLLPQNFFYNEEENKVYFQSDIERLTGIDSRRILPVYTIDLTTKQIVKITTNKLDTIVPNYRAKKLVNITANSRRDPNRRIELADLDGSNVKIIRESENSTIKQAILSADGGTVYLVEAEVADSDKLKLWAVKNGISTLVSDKADINIHDVTSNGNRVLFSAKSNTQPFEDLYVYNLDTLETRTLITNQKGRDYQFIMNSDDIFIYRDFVAGRDNIFRFTIASNSNDQITRFAVDDELLSVYQQGDYIYYVTSKGLYVLDFAKPNLYKLVKEGVFFSP